MIRKMVIVFILLVLSINLFAENIPYVIESFYSDWNFITLNTSVKDQDNYWKIVTNKDKITIDFIGSSQKDMLIIGSMINIAKIIKNTSKCPIQNNFFIINEIKNENKKYFITVTKYSIDKSKLSQNNIIDPKYLIDDKIVLKKIGQVVNIWTKENHEYSFQTGLQYLTSQD